MKCVTFCLNWKVITLMRKIYIRWNLSMKRLYIFIILLLAFPNLFAQNGMKITRLKSINNDKTSDPLKRFSSCVSLVNLYGVAGKLDSIPPYTSELFRIAEKQQNDSLLMAAYITIARYYDYKTDTRTELEYLFKALKIADKKYPASLRSIYAGLGGAYLDIPNYQAAIKHLTYALKLIPKNAKGLLYTELYFHFATAYLGMNKLDSALHYIQKTNENLIKNKEQADNAFVYAITADIYVKLGEQKLARDYYERSVDRTVNLRNTYNDAVALNAYTAYLLQQGDFINARRYGLEGLLAARKSQAKKPLLSLAENLRKVYHALNKTDSAYYFATQELVYRDSLYNQKGLNAVQDMTFNEEIRQREEAIKQAELATEHHHNIQYAGIAFGIITFILLIILSSRTIHVNEKWITYLGVLGLLTVFEFINLLIHPYLAEVTHHSPVLMLLVLVLIGALLVPLHHKIEKWMTHVLIEKNKRVRIATAKKLASKLEKGSD